MPRKSVELTMRQKQDSEATRCAYLEEASLNKMNRVAILMAYALRVEIGLLRHYLTGYALKRHRLLSSPAFNLANPGE